MNSFDNGLGDTKRNVTPSMARLRVAKDEHARFILKGSSNGILAQIPHLSNLRDRVVAFAKNPLRGNRGRGF